MLCSKTMTVAGCGRPSRRLMKPKTIERGGRPSRSVVINLETHFCIRAHAPAMFLKCLPFRILARNARMCCSYWCLAPPSFLLTGFLATEWSMCTMKTSYHDSRLQILTISLFLYFQIGFYFFSKGVWFFGFPFLTTIVVLLVASSLAKSGCR